MSAETIDAVTLLGGKESVPSELRTAQWSRLAQWIRERSFYMAGVHRAELLEEFRKEVELITAGETGLEESRKRMEQFLAGAGYQPEPGQAGTIKDLRSMRRIQTSLRTNVQLLQGWAQKTRGLQAQTVIPAWELRRFGARLNPRDWQERFRRAGGTLTKDGRMIALKTSPVWEELGNGEKDSLGVDYPPFAWGSGMGWLGVKRSEADKLNLLKNWKAPKAPGVIGSPNESLQTSPAVKSPDLKTALSQKLKGLAEWQGEILVFTDPNGTRPYAAKKLAEIITAPLPDGFPNLQAAAGKAWADDALVNIKLRGGTDVVDDFVRLVKRTEPLPAQKPVWRGEYFSRREDLEDRLQGLADGTPVEMVADSWSLLESVAEKFARAKRLPYQLVILCRTHGSLRPIYPVISKVLPKYAGQAEVIALEGTRFRAVGEPIFTRVGGVVRIQLEVEELP